MNNRIPEWSAWKTPDPSPYFNQRVWQKLGAARAAARAPAAWWEGWAISGALAGATALLLVGLNAEPTPRRTAFAPVPDQSLTVAYADALRGN